MIQSGTTETGRFCWLDLAATDAGRATAFYGGLFGWRPQEQAANNGRFIRMSLSDRDVGSVYQLRAVQIERGMLSHWTPYIRVGDLEEAAQRARFLGGSVLVSPFTVTGIARIALIADSVGACVGLWQPLAAGKKADRNDHDA